MYSRSITIPPKKLVENNKAYFGSFAELPPSIDIIGLKTPFGGFPLPSFLTKLRIRSNFSHICFSENYTIVLGILDAKIFAYSEIVVWNNKTGQKYAYRNVTGIRRRVVPKNLEQMRCRSKNSKRDISIYWNTEKNTLSVSLFAKGDSYRPEIQLKLSNKPQERFLTASFCIPAPIKNRCCASAQIFTSLQGTMELSFKNKPKEIHTLTSDNFFDIRRFYCPLRTYTSYLMGFGTYKDKKVFFRITDSNILATDSYSYNENFLYYDNQLTLLPPVKITQPQGTMGKWVIQDTESMIDLSFMPVSDNMRKMSLVIIHTEYHCIKGNFSGALVTQDGEEILLKDFSGIIRKVRLRF
ncbi:MAG: DUF2804 family protein [Spirochaetaceae bacterium]|nr:DUF2804 family protein [Spirochaetaceae bacterium]